MTTQISREAQDIIDRVTMYDEWEPVIGAGPRFDAFKRKLDNFIADYEPLWGKFEFEIVKNPNKPFELLIHLRDKDKFLHMIGFKKYQKDLFFLHRDGYWAKFVDKDAIVDQWIKSKIYKTKSLIENALAQINSKDPHNKQVMDLFKGVNIPFNPLSLRAHALTDARETTPTKGIAFLNNIFEDKEGNKVDFRTEKPFTNMQIKKNYVVMESIHPTMIKFLNHLSNGDKNKKKDLLRIWAMGLSSTNFRVFPVLYSKEANVGKSVFAELLEGYVDHLATRLKASVITTRQEGSFSLRDIKNKTWGVFEELPDRLRNHSLTRIKEWTSAQKVAFESKGSNEAVIDSTITFFASTNHIPQLDDDDDDGFMSRVAFYEVGEKKIPGQPLKYKLSSDEWKELINDDLVFASIIPTLVEEFKEMVTGHEVRNKLLPNNDNYLLVNQAKETSLLKDWLNDEYSVLIETDGGQNRTETMKIWEWAVGKTRQEVFKLYEKQRTGSNDTPKRYLEKISSVRLGKELIKSGLITAKSSGKRVYKEAKPWDESDLLKEAKEIDDIRNSILENTDE